MHIMKRISITVAELKGVIGLVICSNIFIDLYGRSFKAFS